MAGFSNGNGTSVGLELTPVSGTSLGNELTFLGFAIRPAFSTDLTLGTLPSSLTFARAGQATQYDSTGKLTYAPNNLLLNSATLSTQSITTVAGNYIISMYGTGSITLSGTATGTITGTGAANQVYLKVTTTAGALTATVSGSVTSAVAAQVTYETTPRPQDQVITTSAAYYGPRFDYNPNTLAPLGLLIEGSATNLLLNSKADGTNLATQNVTVTAQAYALSFYGTGTVTLSGASTAGPAVGSGAFPARQTLTFTPTAGTLTLTVTGTVQYAQFETGSYATSYIPTAASVVTRAADIVQQTNLALIGGFNPNAGALIVEVGQLATVNQLGIIAEYNTISYLNTVGFVKADATDTYAGSYLNAGAYDGAFTVINLNSNGNDGGSHRLATSWSASSFSAVADGGTVSTGTHRSPSPTKFSLGARDAGTVYPINAHIRSLAIYNQALPSAALKSKSIVGAPY